MLHDCMKIYWHAWCCCEQQNADTQYSRRSCIVKPASDTILLILFLKLALFRAVLGSHVEVAPCI